MNSELPIVPFLYLLRGRGVKARGRLFVHPKDLHRARELPVIDLDAELAAPGYFSPLGVRAP